jgi:transposase
MLYGGIDLHKETLYVTLQDEAGQTVHQKELSSDTAQVEHFFQTLPEQSITLALEPVSSWRVYYDLFRRLGYQVHLAHARSVRALSDSAKKTDAYDSTLLAELLRSNFLPEAYIAPREVMNIRDQVRLRRSLIQVRTQMKNRIRAVLSKNGLRAPVKDVFGKRGRMFIGTAQIQSPRGLKEFWEVIDVLDRQIDILDEEIMSLAEQSPEAMTLTTIHGVSYYSALVIISAIGEVGRFRNWRTLAAYAGLVPSVRASGGAYAVGPTVRRGNGLFRSALMGVVTKHLTLQTPLGLYYQRMASRKRPSTARLATARILVRSIYHMLKRKQVYRYTPVWRGSWWGRSLSRGIDYAPHVRHKG